MASDSRELRSWPSSVDISVPNTSRSLSPSSKTTDTPLERMSLVTSFARVDLPEAERPVIQINLVLIFTPKNFQIKALSLNFY